MNYVYYLSLLAKDGPNFEVPCFSTTFQRWSESMVMKVMIMMSHDCHISCDSINFLLCLYPSHLFLMMHHTTIGLRVSLSLLILTKDPPINLFCNFLSIYGSCITATFAADRDQWKALVEAAMSRRARELLE